MSSECIAMIATNTPLFKKMNHTAFDQFDFVCGKTYFSLYYWKSDA